MGDHVVNLDTHSPLAVSRLAPPRQCNSRRQWRWVINIWLVFHLMAIISAPAALDPSSELTHFVHGLCQPYLEALFLDHGYHFFAPEPEESTLLSFEAERPDGTVVRGRIPDRATQPRLLYHRYFMLTEHVSKAPEELRGQWHESYARHLGRAFGASRVKLIQQTHLLSSMERVRAGGHLTDPASYEDHPLGDFACDAY